MSHAQAAEQHVGDSQTPRYEYPLEDTSATLAMTGLPTATVREMSANGVAG